MTGEARSERLVHLAQPDKDINEQVARLQPA
jgi:hypothetical protein